MNFFDGGTAIGTATLGSDGQAILITSTLAVGSHTITTTYAGDINFNGSNGSLNTNPQVVNQTGSTATTTTLISSQNPSNLSQSVIFTATVSGSGGTPTGSVTFTDTTTSQTLGTVTLTTIGGAQQAAFTMSALPAGTHHIQASYNGDANFAASYAAIDQTVNKANPVGSFNQSLATTVFSEPVTFTLTLSQAPPGGFTPTGTATFSDGGNLLASATLANIGGGQAQATFTTATLSIGSHTITASYGGDNNFNGTSITEVQKVIAANSNTTVSASLNPSSFGQTVTFTASVTPASPATATPTGTVTFSVNGGTGIPVMLSGGSGDFHDLDATRGKRHHHGHLRRRWQFQRQRGIDRSNCHGGHQHNDAGVVSQSKHLRPVGDLYRQGLRQRRHADRQRHFHRSDHQPNARHRQPCQCRRRATGRPHDFIADGRQPQYPGQLWRRHHLRRELGNAHSTGQQNHLDDHADLVSKPEHVRSARDLHRYSFRQRRHADRHCHIYRYHHQPNARHRHPCPRP